MKNGFISKRVEGWMREPSPGIVQYATLYPLSLVYGGVVLLRKALYRTGVYNSFTLDCKVVSVGNITVGGTGKTPLAIALAAYFESTGRRVVVLSRGYGRTTKGIRIVSDGKGVLLGPSEAGDEPYLMARRLQGVAVVVGEDRVAAGSFAVERFSPDVIVLDDGFQHMRLKRDLDILLVDGSTGFGNGHLLPMGVLREPLSGIERAGAVLVKGGGLNEGDRLELARSGRPVLSFSYSPLGLIGADGDRWPVDYLKGKRVLAFAGLANPGPFFSSLGELGASVVKKIPFPDHHPYGPSDVELIKKEAKGAGLAVTTEKDMVKLSGLNGLPLFALAIGIRTDGWEMGELLKTIIEK